MVQVSGGRARNEVHLAIPLLQSSDRFLSEEDSDENLPMSFAPGSSRVCAILIGHPSRTTGARSVGHVWLEGSRLKAIKVVIAVCMGTAGLMEIF